MTVASLEGGRVVVAGIECHIAEWQPLKIKMSAMLAPIFEDLGFKLGSPEHTDHSMSVHYRYVSLFSS